MLKVLKITLGITVVSVLAVGGPIMLARHYLESARISELEKSNPNYLSHEKPPVEEAQLNKKLATVLSEDYKDIDAIPRVFLTRLPESLADYKGIIDGPRIDSKARKRLFISTMLPLILRANELIEEDRKTISRLQAKISKGYLLRAREKTWVTKLFQQYLSRSERKNIGQHPTIADLDKLLYRLDTIPPSLALAQAAIESGWGRSRFSQEGNALFGQWVWDDTSPGLVPMGREEGKTHRVKSFEYLLDSVRGYMINLNRNSNYPDLRKRRAELKRHSLPVTGVALAPALIKYSERGAVYTTEVITLINFNGFDALDEAKLEPETRIAQNDRLVAAR